MDFKDKLAIIMATILAPHMVVSNGQLYGLTEAELNQARDIAVKIITNANGGKLL